jgi:hypothetical protein
VAKARSCNQACHASRRGRRERSRAGRELIAHHRRGSPAGRRPGHSEAYVREHAARTDVRALEPDARRRWLAEQPHTVSEHDRDDLHDDLVKPTKRQHLASNVGTKNAHCSIACEFLGPRQRDLEVRDRFDR